MAGQPTLRAPFSANDAFKNPDFLGGDLVIAPEGWALSPEDQSRLSCRQASESLDSGGSLEICRVLSVTPPRNSLARAIQFPSPIESVRLPRRLAMVLPSSAIDAPYDDDPRFGFWCSRKLPARPLPCRE